MGKKDGKAIVWIWKEVGGGLWLFRLMPEYIIDKFCLFLIYIIFHINFNHFLYIYIDPKFS